MGTDDKKSGDKIKFEIPTTLFTGLVALYLLKITIADYRENGPTDLWTIVSAVFFLISVFSFVQALRKKAD